MTLGRWGAECGAVGMKRCQRGVESAPRSYVSDTLDQIIVRDARTDVADDKQVQGSDLSDTPKASPVLGNTRTAHFSLPCRTVSTERRARWRRGTILA